MSLLAWHPYRCRQCGHRFLRFRRAGPEKTSASNSPTEREIRETRAGIQWKRQRREFLLYGLVLLLFLAFLYFLTRERDGSPEGS
jgi:hypothetical protein